MSKLYRKEIEMRLPHLKERYPEAHGDICRLLAEVDRLTELNRTYWGGPNASVVAHTIETDVEILDVESILD